MIILDTNVISETVRPEPDAGVMAWLNGQLPSSLFLTSISAGELAYGIAALPEGRRKDMLGGSLEGILAVAFASRVLPFDTAAARIYGERMALARRRGLSVAIADGQIAAIAIAHGAAVATRDVAPFKAMGVGRIIDPWTRQTWVATISGNDDPLAPIGEYRLGD